MAGMDYGSVAFDHAGVMAEPWFRSPAGVVVQVRRQWLRAEVGGVALIIQSGELTIGDLSIYAERGGDQQVYAAIWSGYEHDGSLRGIVCAGYYEGHEDHSAREVAELQGRLARWSRRDVPSVLSALDLLAAGELTSRPT
jgi:hypothetical protein